MDTSETYIKMCEKAEEIQKVAPYDLEGEFAFDPYIEKAYQFGEGGDSGREGFTWLPRQDQLQAMIWDGKSYPLILIDQFRKFVASERKYEASMEQLWLSFVMSELYHKIWDGGIWINQKLM